MIRTMAGLCVFKHDPVTVVGVAADDGQAVVVMKLQIFLIDLRHLFHGHDPFAGDDRDMKDLLDIIIDGILRNLFCKSPDHIFEKIIVIEDQRLSVEIVKALDIV